MSLNEISGYNDLLREYQTHKDQPWNEWLDLVSVFPRPGKQGLVGLFQSKSKPHLKLAFKISRYINYLPVHEYTVMSGLLSLADYCPHFLRGIGLINTLVEPSFKKDGNPFEITSKHPIEKEMLLMEYIDRASKFYNYIRDTKWNENIYYNIIKQTLLCVYLAKKYKFTHYDLHSNNIMIKKCDRDLVMLYISQNKGYSVPTQGYYPVIIDYGFGYSAEAEGQPVWASLGHTDVGFNSNVHDTIADPKLFLVSVSEEIHDLRHSRTSRIFRNITRNLFAPLSIQWDCGWDKERHSSVSDRVLNSLKKYTVSNLFRDYDCYCMDLIQTLFTLPLKKQDTRDLYLSYTIFQQEFLKVEQQVGSPYYTLYILKRIVDVARSIQDDYSHSETRAHALEYFRLNFYNILNAIGDFCNPKDVHLEKMLCSLLCLAKCIEGEMYHAFHSVTQEKYKEYQKLPLPDTQEMWKVLEVNLPHVYKFTSETTVMVVDQDTERNVMLTLTEGDAERVNSVDTFLQGDVLYEIYKNSSIINEDHCS